MYCKEFLDEKIYRDWEAYGKKSLTGKRDEDEENRGGSGADGGTGNSSKVRAIPTVERSQGRA